MGGRGRHWGHRGAGGGTLGTSGLRGDIGDIGVAWVTLGTSGLRCRTVSVGVEHQLAVDIWTTQLGEVAEETFRKLWGILGNIG